jgi:hypothetical protein
MWFDLKLRISYLGKDTLMRIIWILIAILLVSTSCSDKPLENAKGKSLRIECKINCYEEKTGDMWAAVFELSDEDARALYDIIQQGVPVEDRYDQDWGLITMYVDKKKPIKIDFGRSGIARYGSNIVEVDLVKMNSILDIYLEKEKKKKIESEPNARP